MLDELINDLAVYPTTPDAIYVSVRFYDDNLRAISMEKVNDHQYADILTEFAVNRTIRGVPVFVVADKRHPLYRIV